MSTKDRAFALFQQHFALATTDGRNFRKTVMDTLMAETGCTLSAAATHYNTAKKAHEASNGAIDGLGRAPVPAGVRKAVAKVKPTEVKPDNECFSVIELVLEGSVFKVGRCQAFLMQGDASEKFDEKVEAWPACHWIMINGLGPNHGDTFELDEGEAEIKRYDPPEAA